MVRHRHRRAFRLSAVAVLAVVGGATAWAEPAGGSRERGARIVADGQRGNCSVCHQIPGLGQSADAQGDIGPPLDGVASRYSVEELRLRVIDPRRVKRDTVMPAYGVSDGLFDVQLSYRGKPILTAQEIEDVVAYLETLK